MGEIRVIGHPAISVLVCLALLYLLAIAIFPLVRRRDALSVGVVALASVAIWACLFIIPSEYMVLRGVTALLNVDLFFRLIDFTRQNRRGAKFGWGRHSYLPGLPADTNVCPTNAKP